jgi:hypothetical protein
MHVPTFYFLCFNVNVVSLRPHGRVTKEVAKIGMYFQFSRVGAWMPNNDSTSESVQVPKVWSLPPSADTSHATVSMRHKIVQNDVVVKRVGPELKGKSRSMKHIA